MNNTPTNPMAEALIYVQQSSSLVDRSLPLPFVHRHQGPTHDRLFTAILISPLTGEGFPCVEYTDNGALTPIRDEGGQIIWYRKLIHAKRSACANFLDSMDRRYRTYFMPPWSTERGRIQQRCASLPSLFPNFGANQTLNNTDAHALNINESIAPNGEVWFGEDAEIIRQPNWDELVHTIRMNIQNRDGLYVSYGNVHPAARQRAGQVRSSIIESPSTLRNVMMNDNYIDNNLANLIDDEITLVDDARELISHCNLMKDCSWIAIDAEIHGGNTVCLISAAFVNPHTGLMNTIVVDAIALHSMISVLLGPLLSDQAILKIIHSCGSMDASSLYHSFGIVMMNVVDTQVMYHSVIRRGGLIGLIELLKESFAGDEDHLLSIQGHAALKVVWQNTNWATRPLRQGQVVYSGLDVMRLPGALQWLWSQLGDVNNNHFLQQNVIQPSHEQAARLIVNGGTSPLFESSRLFCAVQRNRMVGHGFGADLNEAKMAHLSRFLTWRHLMTSYFGLSDNDIVQNDCITSTVVLHDDAALIALLARLYTLLY